MRTSGRFSTTWRLLVAAVTLGAATQAGAAMPGLYFAGFYMDSALAYSTADVTQPRAEAWRAEVLLTDFNATTLDVEEADFDRTEIGYSFGVGFQFTDYLAAELAYVQMGEVRYTAIGSVQDNEGGGVFRTRVDLRSRARGLGLSGIAIYPIGDRWALDARAGVLLGKKKVRYGLTVQNGGFADGSLKDDSISLTLGAGVNWSMSPGTAIRIGYTQLQQALYDNRNVGSWLFSLKYAW